MAYKGLANIFQRGTRALARTPHYALAFSSKIDSGIKPAPNKEDLLARCKGDQKVLTALTDFHDGDLNSVNDFLAMVEQGLVTYRIDSEGDVVMRVTEKGAARIAARAEEIHKHSVY